MTNNCDSASGIFDWNGHGEGDGPCCRLKGIEQDKGRLGVRAYFRCQGGSLLCEWSKRSETSGRNITNASRTLHDSVTNGLGNQKEQSFFTQQVCMNLERYTSSGRQTCPGNLRVLHHAVTVLHRRLTSPSSVVVHDHLSFAYVVSAHWISFQSLSVIGAHRPLLEPFYTAHIDHSSLPVSGLS